MNEGSPSGRSSAVDVRLCFRGLLISALRERRMSVVEWARLAGITQGHASNLLAGRRLPPPYKLAEWLRPLALTQGDLDRFLLAAHLAHTPEPVARALAQIAVRFADPSDVCSSELIMCSACVPSRDGAASRCSLASLLRELRASGWTFTDIGRLLEYGDHPPSADGSVDGRC